MKRVFLLSACLCALAFGLAACGGDDDDTTTTEEMAETDGQMSDAGTIVAVAPETPDL